MQLFTFLKVFVLKIYDNNTITQNRDRTYYVLHKNCFYDKYCLFIFHNVSIDHFSKDDRFLK